MPVQAGRLQLHRRARGTTVRARESSLLPGLLRSQRFQVSPDREAKEIDPMSSETMSPRLNILLLLIEFPASTVETDFDLRKKYNKSLLLFACSLPVFISHAFRITQAKGEYYTIIIRLSIVSTVYYLLNCII